MSEATTTGRSSCARRDAPNHSAKLTNFVCRRAYFGRFIQGLQPHARMPRSAGSERPLRRRSRRSRARHAALL